MKTYEDGLNEAWEAARKIGCLPEAGGLTLNRLCDIFDTAATISIFKEFSPSEAIKKIKEYEEKQKEPVIKIGDRVRTLVDKDSMGVELFPVGTIGEVTAVGVEGNAIEVSVGNRRWYYHKEDIELANDVFLVGDEVYLLDKNYRGVVTAVWEHCGVKVETLTQSGKLSCTDAKDLHRTGRRFPEIANILKQMQEGTNEQRTI